MKNTNYIGSWIKRFLVEYLVTARNLSKNTQESYRDTFKLLLPFVSRESKKAIDRLLLEDINANVVKAFLQYLETNRSCSLSTRNQRLAAIHAFGKFVGLNNPEYVEWCHQIRMVPLKKAQHTLI